MPWRRGTADRGGVARFEVVLTEGAEQDLEAIHDYICEFDSEANANRVLDAVMDVVESQSRFPGPIRRDGHEPIIFMNGLTAIVRREMSDIEYQLSHLSSMSQ